MTGKLIDIISSNPPDEVNALVSLMKIVVQADQYRDLIKQSFGTQSEKNILLQEGYFAGADFVPLIFACSPTKSVNTGVVRCLLNQLLDSALVFDSDVVHSNASVRYRWNKDRIGAFIDLNAIDNLLLGPSYVAKKYRKSVPPIRVTKAGDEFAGTGFLTVHPRNAGQLVIVTAKHNVDPAEGVTSIEFSRTEGVSYRALSPNWIAHPNLDVAIMPVECSDPLPIYLIGSPQVLSRVITLGYPRVATAADTYLLAHRGELNAEVISYQDNQPYLIISNIVAPGNSGGPVLDEAGLCAGMVVRELETKHDSGVSRFSAAIPSKAILQFLSAL